MCRQVPSYHSTSAVPSEWLCGAREASAVSAWLPPDSFLHTVTYRPQVTHEQKWVSTFTPSSALWGDGFSGARQYRWPLRPQLKFVFSALWSPSYKLKSNSRSLWGASSVAELCWADGSHGSPSDCIWEAHSRAWGKRWQARGVQRSPRILRKT